jgi:hypothetical protein
MKQLKKWKLFRKTVFVLISRCSQESLIGWKIQIILPTRNHAVIKNIDAQIVLHLKRLMWGNGKLIHFMLLA